MIADVAAEHMEIDARLVGPRNKDLLERFAPSFGMTPTDLLRSALTAGLVGSEPILADAIALAADLMRDAAAMPPTPREPS